MFEKHAKVLEEIHLLRKSFMEETTTMKKAIVSLKDENSNLVQNNQKLLNTINKLTSENSTRDNASNVKYIFLNIILENKA